MSLSTRAYGGTTTCTREPSRSGASFWYAHYFVPDPDGTVQQSSPEITAPVVVACAVLHNRLIMARGKPVRGGVNPQLVDADGN